MSDALAGVYAKLNRANEHFKAVKVVTTAYYASDFDDLGVDFDGDDRTAYRGTIPPIPVPLQAIVGDCVHNLRSALDHLANRLVEAFDGKPTRDTSFPACKVPPTANKSGISPSPHIAGLDRTKAAAPLALIAEQQPYTLGAAYTEHPLSGITEFVGIFGGPA